MFIFCEQSNPLFLCTVIKSRPGKAHPFIRFQGTTILITLSCQVSLFLNATSRWSMFIKTFRIFLNICVRQAPRNTSFDASVRELSIGGVGDKGRRCWPTNQIVNDSDSKPSGLDHHYDTNQIPTILYTTGFKSTIAVTQLYFC